MRSIDDFRGPRDESVLDPAAIAFTALQGRSTCTGCLFAGQWAKTCHKAAEEAVKRGLPDCDDNVVYQAVERDPRQVELAV